MMVLYEIKNGKKRKVYGLGSVEEFVDTLIYANSISGNMTSNEEISIDYELIFLVSEKVLITNSTCFEERRVYTQEEYANSYANIRVNVARDFEVMATASDEVTISAKKKSDYLTASPVLHLKSDTKIVSGTVLYNGPYILA